MALLVFTLLMYIWLQRRLYKEPIPQSMGVAARVGIWWKVVFKAKKTPPLEIAADTEALVLKSLMAKKINYRDIVSIERIP